MINLEKKNIIITGASGGIGNSIVKRLNEAGANILASGTRIEKLEKLKKNFEGIKILKFDISQSNKIEEFIENATNELGGSLDGMVNNAGITQDNLAIRMSLDEWQKVININLTSTFLMSKFAIKKMLKNKSGKIINITSVVGHTGNLGQANYTASKAGIVAMSKSLAIEYAKKKININGTNKYTKDYSLINSFIIKSDLIINTTPINPLNKKQTKLVKSTTTISDIVYQPKETSFLKEFKFNKKTILCI